MYSILYMYQVRLHRRHTTNSMIHLLLHGEVHLNVCPLHIASDTLQKISHNPRLGVWDCTYPEANAS